MHTRRLLAVALVALALAGGCSSGSGKKKASSSSSTSEAPTSSILPAAQPAQGAAPWPAPPNPMELTRKAGLTPEPAESLQFHVHAHLDVFLNGSAVEVPAGIGIDITDPAVHSGPDQNGKMGYGGISPACAKPCISPLHTHQVDGVLHTESPTNTPHTLGQFFTEWNVRLDASCVGGYCKPDTSVLIYVDGTRFTGDPTTIQLTDRKEIAIVIGTPPATIPKKVPF
ncbi:MAG TPA: hypothetical protein VFA83_17455 [Acidimicrobiales bacterium]|nr:hypothetical protein [Acidimicrobiales bacterium]